jgi:hypothetical protein
VSPPRYPALRSVQRQAGTPQHVVADVCVVGSGAAGISAALEARRLGASVVLVDAGAQLGGQAINSAIGTICGLYSNGPTPARVTHGVMDGLLSELIAAGQAAPRRARNTIIIDYSINAWMRWIERALVAASVQLLPGVIVSEVELADARICALHAHSRFGALRIEANTYIDASGDAVLPWLAGATLNEADEPIYGTVMAVFENVDTEICDSYERSVYHEAMRAHGADFGLVRFDGFIFAVAQAGKVLANLTHIETPMDPLGLAQAGIEGRRQVDALLELFRQELPAAFAHARVATYGQPGIRQTRTISGRSSISVADVRNGLRPADAVARCSWPIELHTNIADAHWDVFDDEHMHYVPLGAMTPVGLDNVAVAGRCIDAEPAALASVRVMGACFAMGKAAASAVSRAGSGSVHQLDISALQRDLADNLSVDTVDPWLASVTAERGPEAHGTG